MKGKTSEWLSTLTIRSLKDLINLLFELRPKAREDRAFELYEALLWCIDDEYHAHKKG
jgi:hypothetical protein